MHNDTRPSAAVATGDAGFTLAETLVALVLTLGIIGAALSTFNSSVTLVGTSRVVSDTNQGLQAGMSLMERDLIQTGQGIPLGGIPIPADAAAGGPTLLIKRPSSSNVNLKFPYATTLTAISTGQGLGPTLLGVTTDIVTLFYVDRTLALDQYPLVAIAADGSTMTVDARTPITATDGIKSGDLIMFTNSQGSTVQTVTQTPVTQTVSFQANDALNLNQRAAPQGTILDLQSPVNQYPETHAYRVLMITYEIDNTAPALPRLVRRVNNGAPLAVAMGIENLQFSYDIVDGVVNPTNVDEPPINPATNPPVPYSANQIRKVNIYMAARSQDLNPQTRKYYRNSMSTQVGLRSLSFRDRYF